ncbi:hypothetical protein [Shimia sp. SDUM112013]|uniref:hypothetical protein n=1 Tax=Shimia sp. SDUM112013 TaxID=3136160 RepID=UPI0032EC8412
MNQLFPSILTAAVFVFCKEAIAEPASAKMSDRLVKQTTDLDRIDMAQWSSSLFETSGCWQGGFPHSGNR